VVDHQAHVGAEHRLDVPDDVLGRPVGAGHDVDLHQLAVVRAHAHRIHVAQATDGGLGPAGKGGFHRGHAS
jgi:hypothetical protein